MGLVLYIQLVFLKLVQVLQWLWTQACFTFVSLFWLLVLLNQYRVLAAMIDLKRPFSCSVIHFLILGTITTSTPLRSTKQIGGHMEKPSSSIPLAGSVMDVSSLILSVNFMAFGQLFDKCSKNRSVARVLVIASLVLLDNLVFLSKFIKLPSLKFWIHPRKYSWRSSQCFSRK